MPENVVKYKVFVASPSDVRDERLSVNEVVEELNLTFGRLQGIIIEVVKWETHSAPGIAGTGSVQKIINADIGKDYDLFIGILWKKFGTPTDTADSGTEEEFNNAYDRFLTNSSSLQILFYFNNSAPSFLNEINIEQLAKVSAFKSRLGEKGILYWEYNTKEELQRFLRIHIQKRIHDLRSLDGGKQEYGSKDTSIEDSTPITDLVIEGELGTFDYQELAEEHFDISTNALLRISEATGWIGVELNKKTEEMRSINKGGSEIGKKVLRDFFQRTAAVMNDFASRLEPEIPIFITNFEKGAEAYTKLLGIRELSTIEDSEVEASDIKTLEILQCQIDESIDNVRGFLQSVTELPRIAKEINSARSNVESRLKELLNTLLVSHDIAGELNKNLTKD